MKTTLSIKATQKQSQVLAADLIENIHLLELPFNDLLTYLERVSEENLFIDSDAIMSVYQVCSTERNNTTSYINNSSYSTQNNDPKDHDAWIQALSSRQDTPTLKQYLLWQLGGVTLGTHLKQTCIVLINSLDQYGFLSDSKSDICKLSQHISNYYDEALTIIKTLDPPGVASQNIADCLKAQIPVDHPRKDLLISLVTHFWSNLIRGHITAIKRGLRISDQQFSLLMNDLQTFHPIPACGFASENNDSFISCDIIFSITESGTIDFYLVGRELEKAPLINDEYTSLLQSYTTLIQQKDKASKIIHGIKQRYHALELLGLYIIEKQRNFFFNGKRALIPLTMQDAAYDLGLSASSISRIVKDKYAYTPFGTIALKTFFSQQTALSSIGQNPISQENLLATIKEIINNEDPLFPLNDMQIVEILENQYGMTVSRRTISKYRDRCGIPSQIKRKNLMKIRSLQEE